MLKLLPLINKVGERKNKKNLPPTDPDDRWFNVYREKEKNILYRWVGDKAGELIANLHVVLYFFLQFESGNSKLSIHW